MHTLEQVVRTWDWFLLRFVRVLSQETIWRVNEFILYLKSACKDIVKQDGVTPLSEGAEYWLEEIEYCLANHSIFFAGYMCE